jgi:hypothetical protein
LPFVGQRSAARLERGRRAVNDAPIVGRSTVRYRLVGARSRTHCGRSPFGIPANLSALLVP